MKLGLYNDVDVVVIQKQTTLERYTKRSLNIDFYDYLEQDKQGKDALESAHLEHLESRKIVLEALSRLNLSYVICNLDELKESQSSFFHEEVKNSGIKPKLGIVISLGGDGTLLHASHYIGANVKLLGLNSCPKHSVGHLCHVKSNNVVQVLENVFMHQNYKLFSVKRLRIKVTRNRDGQLIDGLEEVSENLPLALNDILISHLHPAATSRYQISILENKGPIVQSEKQLSSGLWISTAAGSTAAISSYGFAPEPLNSSRILVACREPYAAKGEKLQLTNLMIDGKTQSLSIFSRMRQGLVCLDGPDSCAQFGFGDIIDIMSSESTDLLLIQ